MARTTEPAPPACGRCGRPLPARRSPRHRGASARRWCGERCRRRRLRPVDAALEQALLHLLEGRARRDTICPSEAARRVDAEGWRDRLEDARNAARRLAARGLVDVLQGGRTVAAGRERGPFRLRARAGARRGGGDA